MVRSLSTSDIIAKASRGYIKDYYVDGSFANTDSRMAKMLRPPSSFYDLLTLMGDHTFNTEVNILVDAIMKEGYGIYNKDDYSKRDDAKEQEFESKFRGYRLLKQALMNLIVYRNAFLEVVKKNDAVDELHTLETTEMNVNVDEHGEILGFTQTHYSGPVTTMGAAKKQVVFFTPEEAIHIAPSRITTNPWGYVDTRSIKPIVEAKLALENYISGLFRDNKFRDLWVIQNAKSPDQVKNFISSIKEGKLYPDKDIVVEGEIEQKQLRSMADFQFMLQLHSEYKSLIREFLRVPPLMTGESDNKSSGEFQVRYAFDNTVVSWHRTLADEITNELFPLMGWEGFELRFNALDKPSQKNAIEMAVQLKGLGYNDETIHKFLIINGVKLPKEAAIKTPEEIAKEQETMMQSDNAIIGQKLQNMNAPSRKPRSKSKIDTNLQENVETRQEQKTGK